MEFLNDLLLKLPYYSFNYLFSIIVVILLSYVLNMYRYGFSLAPMTDFFYNCYELFSSGMEKIVGSAEKIYRKVRSQYSNEDNMANHVDNYVEIICDSSIKMSKYFPKHKETDEYVDIDELPTLDAN